MTAIAKPCYMQISLDLSSEKRLPIFKDPVSDTSYSKHNVVDEKNDANKNRRLGIKAGLDDNISSNNSNLVI